MRSRDSKLEIKCSSRQAMIKKWLCMSEGWYLHCLAQTAANHGSIRGGSSLQLEIKVHCYEGWHEKYTLNNNGPQFDNTEFWHTAKEWRIKNTGNSPKYPQKSGEVEREFRTGSEEPAHTHKRTEMITIKDCFGRFSLEQNKQVNK